MSSFGERIKETRKLRGLTQEALGEALGVDKRVISKYENNLTIPSVVTANTIAEILETSLDYLIGNHHSQKFDQQIVKRMMAIESLEKSKKLSLFDLIDTYIKGAK